MAHDGYVHWEGSRYGVPWRWAGATVQVGQRSGTEEIWTGDQRLAVHPRAEHPGQRFTAPSQWEGLPRGDGRPQQEAVAVQVTVGDVERRSLGFYELAALGGVRLSPWSRPVSTWRVLGLKQAAEALDNTLDAVAGEQLTYPEMLTELLGVEVDARRERYLTTRTKLAHLPFQRSIEQFDFDFQPSVDERQVKELANLAFVAEATNILLLGPPGVGKTHLAVALALKAIGHGYGAYFVRAYDLMEDLRRAQAEQNLRAAHARLPRSQGPRRRRVRHLAL